MPKARFSRLKQIKIEEKMFSKQIKQNLKLFAYLLIRFLRILLFTSLLSPEWNTVYRYVPTVYIATTPFNFVKRVAIVNPMSHESY